MKIILSEKEKKQLKRLQYVGDQQDFKVYDKDHNGIMQANINILCDCGKKRCKHRRLLLLKLLKEYKVINNE